MLGGLDGIETGVRQLVRDEPLALAVVDYRGVGVWGVPILKRNATRACLDFVALADRTGPESHEP